MDQGRFDRLARRFANAPSTRRVFLGAIAVLLGQRTAAAQTTSLPGGTCTQEGQWCSLGAPCCAGLVCQTSFANPIFGVCIASTTTSGTGFVLPTAPGSTTTTSTDEKGPGGRRHRAHERKMDRVHRRHKRSVRRKKQTKRDQRHSNNGNGSDGQSFQDDYMLDITGNCAGSGSADTVTVRNTGSQPITIGTIKSKVTGENVVVFTGSNEASAIAPGRTGGPYKNEGAGASTDILSTDPDEVILVTAWRGAGASVQYSSPLQFRAFCDGRKSKRIK